MVHKAVGGFTDIYHQCFDSSPTPKKKTRQGLDFTGFVVAYGAVGGTID
jgi:hypothetical protein